MTTQHALKIEAVEIKESFADEIVATLKSFASDLGYSKDRISQLECRRRDGFIPHSHNLGGIECVAFRDQYTAQINGTGFENADKTLDKYRQYNVEYFLADNESVPKNESDWSTAQQDQFDEYCQNDTESDVLYSLDIMYTGVERGIHTVNVRACVCVKDAPYHRQYDDLIETEITFKTISGLETKLNKLLKQSEFKCFSRNLQEAY